jgi:spore maturation protein CgeB
MSKIKVFHALGVYPGFLKGLKSKYSDLLSRSFTDQIKQVFEDGDGWLNIWHYYFNEMPKFELFTVITNFKSAQEAWALENGFKQADIKDEKEIILKQIERYQPDILFAHSISVVEIIPVIKERVPSIRIIMGWDGVLMHDLNLFRYFDLILTPVKETKEYYKKNGKHAFEFNFGFHEPVLKRIKHSDSKKYGLSFIGQFSPSGQHKSRYQYLSELSQKEKLNLWSPGFGATSVKNHYYGQIKRMIGFKFKEFLQMEKFRYLNKGDIYGIDMFQAINDSKIVFNNHIDHVGNYAANIRLFEVTGAGSCLVTDFKDNLKNYFDIESEIVTYRTTEELLSKVRYLLTHDQERESIARAGQAKTLLVHNYQNRFSAFSAYLHDLFDKS